MRIGTYCPNCDTLIDGGVIWAFDGRPDDMILLEDFQCTSFECPNCETVVYTPDYESMCEIDE